MIAESIRQALRWGLEGRPELVRRQLENSLAVMYGARPHHEGEAFSDWVRDVTTLEELLGVSMGIDRVPAQVDEVEVFLERRGGQWHRAQRVSASVFHLVSTGGRVHQDSKWRMPEDVR